MHNYLILFHFATPSYCVLFTSHSLCVLILLLHAFRILLVTVDGYRLFCHPTGYHGAIWSMVRRTPEVGQQSHLNIRIFLSALDNHKAIKDMHKYIVFDIH